MSKHHHFTSFTQDWSWRADFWPLADTHESRLTTDKARQRISLRDRHFVLFSRDFDFCCNLQRMLQIGPASKLSSRRSVSYGRMNPARNGSRVRGITVWVETGSPSASKSTWVSHFQITTHERERRMIENRRSFRNALCRNPSSLCSQGTKAAPHQINHI